MEHFIRMSGRAGGKTHAIMTEIHGLIVSGERPTILVIHPALSHVKFWHDEWVRRFGTLPRPEYAYLPNILKLRGRMGWKHVFVENVDLLDDGWQNEPLQDALIGARGADAEITYTYSPSTLSLRSHNAVVYDQDAYLQERVRRWRRGKKGN